MLLDDKEKTVEYFVSNILAGTITIDLMKLVKLLGMEHIPTTGKYADDPDTFIDIFLNWIKLRKTNPQSKEFRDLTNTLFVVLVRSRLLGFSSGVFTEVAEFEKLLAQCREERDTEHRNNRILAQELEDKNTLIENYEKGAGGNNT